jgi:hypothetical protein
MSLRWTRLLGLALLLSLTSAAVALAALPSPKNRLIVPGKSAGGVKLGGTFAAATQAWGSGGKCTKTARYRVCSYTTSNSGDGSASFSSKPKGKINAIQLLVGYAGGHLNFNTSLAKFKTKKGIKLGSTDSAVRSAYPKAKQHAIPMASNYELWVKGPGKHVTRFQMSGDSPPQVIGIIMQ